MSSTSDVFIFDCTRYPSTPNLNNVCCPYLRLRSPIKDGLSWNGNLTGHLLSASDDTTVRLWDVQASPANSTYLDAKSVFIGHTADVEDVAWHSYNALIFGSVGDDCKLMVWDTCSNTVNKPARSILTRISFWLLVRPTILVVCVKTVFY